MRRKKYYEAHRDTVCARRRAYYDANREDEIAYRKARFQTITGRANTLARSAFGRDRKRGFPDPLRIPDADIIQLLEAGGCEATGVAFDLSPDEYKTRNPRGPSIDKIDRSKPYQLDGEPRNWRLVTWAFNNAHGEMTHPEFLETVLYPVQVISGVNPFLEDDPRHDPLDQIARGVKRRTMETLAIPTQPTE